MSNHDETPSAPLLPRWFFSAVGVVGSIVIMMAVIAIAYNASRPVQAVDSEVAAERKKNLSEVSAKQADFYNNYSLDPVKKTIRIPVADAMGLLAAQLDAATRGKPEAPLRLSLAASPAGFTPPAPPAPAAAAPAASAPAAPASAPAAAPAAASAR